MKKIQGTLYNNVDKATFVCLQNVRTITKYPNKWTDDM